MVLLVTAQFSMAQNADMSAMHSAGLDARYPAGTILTVNVAEQALAEALMMRAQIESQFALDESACYPVFFVSSCLDDAKEHRRVAISRIRPVEIEANTFTRRMRVLERDKALAGRREVLASEAPQRARDQQRNEAEAAQKLLDSAQKLKALQGASNVNAADAGKRVAEHAENLRSKQAKELDYAAARATNMAAYAQKTRDTEARQREISARKLEKERKRVTGKAPGLPSVTQVGPSPSPGSP